MLLKINNIEVSENRRKLNSEKVKELAGSIKEIGLLNPIIINQHNQLIAGNHRLEAVKLLGYSLIEANILDINGLQAELAEIDENLIREELHYIDRGIQLTRRKQIYEELYPETKVGGDRKSENIKTQIIRSDKPTFTEDTSTKTGQSRRTIEVELQIARDIIPEVAEVIRESDITKTEAIKISRLGPEQQKAVVEEIRKPHIANNSGNNEWYTPPEYIEIARRVMGGIDADPASSEIANRTVKAKTYYTEEENGLTKEWHGSVWLNPPYAQPLIAQFAEKLIVEIENGNTTQAMVLVNNATETGWFNTMSAKAKAIWFIKGRVKFLDMYGMATGAPLQGQCILYFGGNEDRFVKECKGLVCRCQYE